MNIIIDTLTAINPWWAKKPVLRYPIIEREILHNVLQLLKLGHIKDILGVRRCGKTTLLYLVIEHLIKNGVNPSKIFFLSFDHLSFKTATFEDIEKAIYQIEIYPDYLFLDEAQEKKDWERWVKQLYDSKRFKQIFVSGSNASLLSKDVGNLLTGRHITTINYPFSFREFLNAHGWKDLSENYLLSEKNRINHFLASYLTNGSFPEVIGKEDSEAKLILSSIYNDIVARDIATRHSIEKEKIDLLAKFLLTNNAKEYSYNSLANAININVETAERYLGYLKDSFLVDSISIFSYKLKTQYKQNKKIYCIDTGMRNSVSFTFSDIGRLYENIVFLELKRRKKDVYYWKGDGEADFVIKEGVKVKEIVQVCYDIKNKKTMSREIKNTIEATNYFKVKEAVIVTEGLYEQRKVDKIMINFIPLWLWLCKT